MNLLWLYVQRDMPAVLKTPGGVSAMADDRAKEVVQYLRERGIDGSDEELSAYARDRGLISPAPRAPQPSSGLASMYRAEWPVIKGALPGIAGVAGTALGGPVAGAGAYAAAKGLLSPEEVKEHPYATAIETASFPVFEALPATAAAIGRTSTGALRPGMKLASELAGAAVGSKVGHPWLGWRAGAEYGPSLAERLIPQRGAQGVISRLLGGAEEAMPRGTSTPFAAPEVAAPGAAGQRLVLTPSEASAQEQIYKTAQKLAHERGMQHAGGLPPARPGAAPFPSPLAETPYAPPRSVTRFPAAEAPRGTPTPFQGLPAAGGQPDIATRFPALSSGPAQELSPGVVEELQRVAGRRLTADEAQALLNKMGSPRNPAADALMFRKLREP